MQLRSSQYVQAAYKLGKSKLTISTLPWASLICDEISTMLDVITQTQIWQLVLRVAAANNLGMLVVTHNMALAQRVCDRIVGLSELNKA